jgi:hypothetical protein
MGDLMSDPRRALEQRSWGRMRPGTSAGRIPARVSLAARARAMAGFAKEMEAPTAKGTADDCYRAHPQITASKPKVATNSLNSWAQPCLVVLIF